MGTSSAARQHEIASRIAGHFGTGWTSRYVRGKIRADPAYHAVWERLRDSPLPLLDVGCGLGLLEFFLREHGSNQRMTGIDMDGEKIGAAQRIAAAHYHDLTFSVNRAPFRMQFLGNVTLLDVLHYLPTADQSTLLDSVRGWLAPGGAVLIRNCVRDGSWRYWVTWLEEMFIKSSGWIRGGRINIPSAMQIQSHFPASEFISEILPLWGDSPFNSYLLVFRRREHHNAPTTQGIP